MAPASDDLEAMKQMIAWEARVRRTRRVRPRGREWVRVPRSGRLGRGSQAGGWGVLRGGRRGGWGAGCLGCLGGWGRVNSQTVTLVARGFVGCFRACPCGVLNRVNRCRSEVGLGWPGGARLVRLLEEGDLQGGDGFQGAENHRQVGVALHRKLIGDDVAQEVGCTRGVAMVADEARGGVGMEVFCPR